MAMRLIPILAKINEIISDERDRVPPDQLSLTLLLLARGDLMAARARMEVRDFLASPVMEQGAVTNTELGG